MQLSLVVLALTLAMTQFGCLLSREGGAAFGGGPSSSSSSSSGTSEGGSGSGTTSATSSGGGAGGGVGGIGGVGGATETDCTNGLDDDGDASADCDDTDCQNAGYSCLAAASNALAYLVLASQCPSASQPKPLRSCDAAACGCIPAPGDCTFGVSRWNGGDCNGQADSSLKTSPNCYYISSTASAFQATTSPTGASMCQAVAVSVPSTLVDACEVTGGSCAGGGACVPPGFPTDAACVLLPAASTCSAPFDGWKEILYDSSSATCDCSCVKSGASCDGTVTAFPQSGCSGTPAATVPMDGQCHAVGTIQSYLISQAIETPTCDASATIPSGTLTLCCKQAP